MTSEPTSPAPLSPLSPAPQRQAETVHGGANYDEAKRTEPRLADTRHGGTKYGGPVPPTVIPHGPT